MNYLNEETGGFAEFGYPIDPDTGERYPAPPVGDMEAGDRITYKTQKQEWELTRLATNKFSNDKGDSYVFNIGAKGIGDYKDSGDVAYWLRPSGAWSVEQAGSPSRQTAQKLIGLCVDLDLTEGDGWADLSGEEILQKLQTCFEKPIPKTVFKSVLKFSWNMSKDGGKVFDETAFTYFDVDKTEVPF